MPLQVLDVQPFGEEPLLDALRCTRLMGAGAPEVYRDADLRLVRGLDTDALAPAQRYVLRDTVAAILELRASLEPFGIDPFALDGGAMITGPEGSTPLLPPVIEESVEPDGRTVLLVNDGMHRVYAARSLGLPITAVVARGVPPEYPYYALALERGWADVAELDELPDGFQKKTYRRPEGYKELFRDFNAVFPGVQEQRRQTNPEHLRA